MKSEDLSLVNIREIIFDQDDFFDKEKMILKLDHLIHAWGQELIQNQHIDDIPDSDEAWLKLLGMDIYWGDLKNQWEHYVVGSLICLCYCAPTSKGIFCFNPIISADKGSVAGLGGSDITRHRYQRI